MANIEMYDYMITVAPDNNVTLSVTPQNILVEDMTRNQVVHLGDDNSEEVISFSDTSIFHVTLQWDDVNESDSGTIVNFWLSASHGDGMAKSFKWDHPVDGHTYVVKFRSNPMKRSRHDPPDYYTISSVVLKVMGRIDD